MTSATRIPPKKISKSSRKDTPAKNNRIQKSEFDSDLIYSVKLIMEDLKSDNQEHQEEHEDPFEIPEIPGAIKSLTSVGKHNFT